MTIYPGDVFQVGGCFVLGPGNLCDYAHRSEYAGLLERMCLSCEPSIC